MTGSIIDTIGNTPIVEITKMNPVKGVKIFAKLEYMNPGGSVKDRPALYMINAAEKTGELTHDKTVIEATSGNTGIGLAMVCAVKGYKLALTMAESASEERKSILRARGAQIILTPRHLGSDGAIEEAYRLARENPDMYFLADQFNNEANWKAHYETTGPEIIDQTNGKITSLVATIGTSGTLMGLSRRLKEYNKDIRIVCVEPYLGHKIQGLKNMKESYTPEIMEKDCLDEKINIDDETAFDTARNLAIKEGLFVGMSSGAAMAAALEEAQKIKKGCIVVIFPDSGERYLSTNLFSVENHISLSLFNTLSKSKTPFKQLEKEKISIYTCGPTVHERLDVGRFRRYAFTDLLVRYIEYHKIAVNHVVNITDYDDKTIQGSQKTCEPLAKFTQTFLDLFKQDLLKLNIRPADAYPKVSDHFDEMIDVARQLQSKKHAYEKLHSLYFDIASQPEYGDFSRTNLDMIKSGATVDLDAYEKGNPKDFTLLKRVRLSELKAGVGIKTQWGNVRPSLHLQCAAIAMKFLGESFDIQTGSRELIFPHHENEVAIARALKGATLARYWLHCDPVRYDGSLGALTMESLTLETLVKKGWGLKTIRFWLISNHYRKTLILSNQALKQAQYTLDKINRCIATLSIIGNGSGFEDMDQFIYDMKSAFFQSMEDDLRISGAISSMLANVKTINRLINKNKINADGAQKLVSCFKEIDSVLKIFSFKEKKQYSRQIQDLIKARDVARQQNDFQAADKIRDQLINLGISVHDKRTDP
ncbi:MAG: cysteine synthase [Deltaproteobacteria bacterium]|uniref:cysteine synthase n=1 Tax=Desulfobacula sp. TaxID=2593537 RepID=UPI0019B3B0DC|nr:cysteine synthase [Candidatus Desulfobacula maris]MBL6993278.1 cysteine synthase [Desulfobacula sp.]